MKQKKKKKKKNNNSMSPDNTHTKNKSPGSPTCLPRHTGAPRS